MARRHHRGSHRRRRNRGKRPEQFVWTVVVVTIGVFFTIVSAPVSYPCVLDELALVPLFATRGRSST